MKAEAFTIDEVERFGNTAYEMSRYVIYGFDSKELDNGKFIAIWKLTAGEWKIHRPIFNSNKVSPQSKSK